MAKADLALGPLRLAHMRTVVLPHDPFAHTGRNLAGTLGRGVFARWTVRVDFAARRLALAEPCAFSPAASALVSTIDLSLGVPIVAAMLRANPEDEARALRLVLDTGTGVYPMLLGGAAADRVGVRQIARRAPTVLGVGAGGLIGGEVARVAELGLEGLTMSDAYVGVAEADGGFFGAGIADGTIGLGYFGRGTLTLDYAARRAIFEPGPDFDRPVDYFDACGWRLDRQSGAAWSVTWVADGGPAQAAGVRLGDQLARVAGAAASDIDADALDVVTAAEGPLPITVSRAGRLIDCKLQRRRLL
jgi:hypothetical protein